MKKILFLLILVGCGQNSQPANTFYHGYAGHGIDDGLEEYLENYPYRLPTELNIINIGAAHATNISIVADARGEPDGSYCEIRVYERFFNEPEYSKHVVIAHELEHCRQIPHDNECMSDGETGVYDFYKLSIMHKYTLSGLNMRLLLQDQSWKDEITGVILESQYDAIMGDTWIQTLCDWNLMCDGRFDEN